MEGELGWWRAFRVASVVAPFLGWGAGAETLLVADVQDSTQLNSELPPTRIQRIVVEVNAVFPTRRRARWNPMAVDGARFVERVV